MKQKDFKKYYGNEGYNLTNFFEQFDFCEREDIENELLDFIKPYEKYLTFAKHCTWNGASGYKIANDLCDCIIRDYDTTQIIKNVSKGGKALKIREYSHDVPTGFDLYIIGLTQNEIEKLNIYQNECYTSFEKIEQFTKKYMEVL